MMLQNNIPDIFTMQNGKRVETKEDWELRRIEIKELYENYMYGPLPNTSEEQISYTVEPLIEKKVQVVYSEDRKEEISVQSGKMEVQIKNGDRTGSFQVFVTLPNVPAPKEGYPLYSEMAFLWGDAKFQPTNNCYYAAKRGYASVVWLPVEIAAWGWGASKILDVMEQGLAKELKIDWIHNILGGVSRYGKATAVAAAYDTRIKMIVPSCSGAGGLAMYRYRSEGRTYDFSSLGFKGEDGTALHTTEKNEFLECLQSQDEGHWFNDAFKEFKSVEELPVDQHFLAALSAAPDRYLFIIHSVIGEDWTNPAAMTLTYIASKKLFDFLELGEHIKLCVHLKGHAILLSDMEVLLDYCDFVWFHKKTEETEQVLNQLGSSVFLEKQNLDTEIFTQYL